MQYPNFGGGKSIMEHLLNFDAVLKQYALASGSPLPDDLVVATVMRCVGDVMVENTKDCEAEFMACIGGCAEGLHLAGVWRFLTREDVEVMAVAEALHNGKELAV